VISIYAGLIPWIAIAWAVIGVTMILRRQRITEWRENRKRKK
jgi:hypothetical protein